MHRRGWLVRNLDVRFKLRRLYPSELVGKKLSVFHSHVRYPGQSIRICHKNHPCNPSWREGACTSAHVFTPCLFSSIRQYSYKGNIFTYKYSEFSTQRREERGWSLGLWVEPSLWMDLPPPSTAETTFAEESRCAHNYYSKHSHRAHSLLRSSWVLKQLTGSPHSKDPETLLLRKAAISFLMSFRPSAWITLLPLDEFWWNFILSFSKNLSRKFKFY